jgi:hypothetical protein
MSEGGAIMQGRTTEQILAEIGQMLAADPEYPVENSLLQAEVDPEMISPSVYKDAGDHIMYRSPDLDRWSDILLELWYAQSGKSRWSEIEYFIRDGRFEVAYIYPDDVDRSDSMKERREQALRRYYGDKPVRYPSWDGGGYPKYDL